MSRLQRQRHLLHAFSTFELGGPQARFVELANALGDRYRHTIVAMDNRFGAAARIGPQVTWQPLKIDVVKGSALANRNRCRDVLRALAPDLLLSYNWGSIEWAAANWPRLCPQIHVEDGFGPEEAAAQLRRRMWMRRVLLGWAKVPVVVASRKLQSIALTQWGLPPESIHFTPNGVTHAASPARSGSPLAGGSVCIGSVAGLRPEKNIGRLIRGFATVREKTPARLVIVGDGPERSQLELLTERLGIASDVEFTGYLADPISRVSSFDLFALSSDTEQLPMALLEAMGSGVPAISTRVGDVPFILDQVAPENLCDPDDRSFSACLAAAVNARDRWQEWGVRGWAVVKNGYSREAMINRWDAIWSEGLSAHA